MTKCNSKNGFTLIELMIVIAIIGILATIILPSMVRSRHQARLSACKTNLRNIAIALQSYSTNDPANNYPTAAMGLSVLQTQGYINTNIPTCPEGNITYAYEGNANTNYTISHSTLNNHQMIGINGEYPIITGLGGLQDAP